MRHITPGDLFIVGPGGAGLRKHQGGHYDGPYERMLPVGTIVVVVAQFEGDEWHANVMSIVDGGLCWLAQVSLRSP